MVNSMDKNRERKCSISNCANCELKKSCDIDDKIDNFLEKRNVSKLAYTCIPIQTFLGIVAFLYGVVLLLPFDTFKSHAYMTLLSLASENTWGIACLLIGLFQILVIFKSKSKFLNVISLSSHIFMWTFIGTMFLVNDLLVGGTLNTAFTTYFSIAGLALFTAWRG